MKIYVTSLGMTPHAPLNDFIDKKAGKLETYCDKILECHITLRAENYEDKDNKFAEMRILVPGDEIVVKKTAGSFEESVDQCTEAAKRLLIKYKETHS